MTIRITKRTRTFWILLGLSLLFFSVLVEVAFAATPPTYQPLVGIPGITTTQGLTLSKYLNAIYLFTISVGALIGVIKISMAGVKYSMSDVITDKASAKKDIVGVLLGLAILLIPFIVLNTIYPGLTNLNVLDSAKSWKVQLDPSRGGQPEAPAPETRLTCATRVFSAGETCINWCNREQGRYVTTPEPACVWGGR